MPRKSILCERDMEPCYRPECRAHGCMDQEYEVTVWDMVEGDIVKKRWDATAAEADEIREQYADDPTKSVQVEPR
jgi:hypothetical protein